ncbi:hypothetical protein HJFPF1_05898 [Paramyrothecium foliicola]|nr:hypothetical protein HJFPF1_05898 [Paramyrothecium foliicola]
MANQQMETAEQIFEYAIKDFKSTLDEKKLERFAGVTVEQIKKRVIVIQADQENQRTLMNFNRIHNFLGAWESFDESCKTLQTGLADLSGLIWGPLDWVLRVANERPKALDRVLQSYLSLGQRLSPITQYRTQLAEHVSLRKCLAWMYCDLLIFHKHILKLFESRDWRTTFETQWKDYNDLGLFNSLLDSCEKNGQCIQRTVSSQLSLDTQRRLNDHVLRNGNVMSEVLDQISPIEEHILTVHSRNGVEVLDDEDEMAKAERKAAVECLASIVRKSDTYSPGRIRVLLVSTDVDDMRAFLKIGDYLDVYELQSSDVQKDIGLYLKKRSPALQSRFRLKDDDVERAIQRILAKSNVGKFLTESMSSLFPKDLEEAYNRILERLRNENESAWEEAKRIFSWLICSRRPLKWHELQAVLSMRVDENGALQHSPIDRLCCDIREVCGSLIRVVGNTIEFIHETVETYVIGNQNLNRGILEADVTLFCLSYISHHCFSNAVDEATMIRYVDEGLYAFQDYAVAKWDSHLITVVTKYADIFRDGVFGESYQQQTFKVLQQLILAHGESLSALRDQQIVMQRRTASECEAVQDMAFYDSLVMVLAHIYRHHEQGTSERHQVGVEGLKQAMGRTRAAIIAWSHNTPAPELVEDYYGNSLYKCSRATCAYFYEGFDSEDKLTHHNDRHDRPYTCPFEAGCSLARFGFASHRDRDRHVRIYHSEDVGGEGDTAQSQINNVDEPETAGRGPKFRLHIWEEDHLSVRFVDEHLHERMIGLGMRGQGTHGDDVAVSPGHTDGVE